MNEGRAPLSRLRADLRALNSCGDACKTVATAGSKASLSLTFPFAVASMNFRTTFFRYIASMPDSSTALDSRLDNLVSWKLPPPREPFATEKSIEPTKSQKGKSSFDTD